MDKIQFAVIEAKVCNAVLAYEEDFAFRNAGRLDFGTCGYAIVLLGFGRKRKIKQEFLDAGFIKENNTWDSYGKKEYVFQLQKPTVGTQYIGFYEDRVRAAVNVLREELDGTGVDVNMHTWVD
jgi:hypothetical protein